jgi:hypothetical protein
MLPIEPCIWQAGRPRCPPSVSRLKNRRRKRSDWPPDEAVASKVAGHGIGTPTEAITRLTLFEVKAAKLVDQGRVGFIVIHKHEMMANF